MHLDFASSVPFSNNIEGFAYMKDRYRKLQSFWKLYLESILYGLLLAGAVSWLLF